jgi:hypothetical protein
MRQILRALVLGAKRRWKTGIAASLAVLGALWLITEISTSVSDSLKLWIDEHSMFYAIAAIALAVIGFFSHAYEVSEVEFQIPTTDSKITICYGDLLAQDTDVIVAVNEFFDGRLGQIVSESSIHGQFIRKYFHSDETAFRNAVQGQLAAKQGEITPRQIEPRERYPIGTVVRVPRGTHLAYLVALSRTHLETHKATADVPSLWHALAAALEEVHSHGNGRDVSLPLLGNGRASINLEPQHLFRLIVLALVDFARKKELPKRIYLVLPWACFHKLDLREIRRDWS